MSTKKYYTTKEAAEIIGVKEREVRAKIERGHFPTAQKVAIKYRWEIPADDLKKWLNRSQS